MSASRCRSETCGCSAYCCSRSLSCSLNCSATLRSCSRPARCSGVVSVALLAAGRYISLSSGGMLWLISWYLLHDSATTGSCGSAASQKVDSTPSSASASSALLSASLLACSAASALRCLDALTSTILARISASLISLAVSPGGVLARADAVRPRRDCCARGGVSAGRGVSR